MRSDYNRVVLHIDLDAAYAQMELITAGLSQSQPAVVVQWEGLLAINYPARALGISRKMKATETREAFPDLLMLHVDVVGEEGTLLGDDVPDRRLKGKASLEKYRIESAKVMGLLQQAAAGAIFEKASIDEAFIDVTALVDAELSAASQGGVGPPPPGPVNTWGSLVVGGGVLQADSMVDRRLAIGAKLACKWRGQLFSSLGYTCSAGVACNKLLAKIGSSQFKPNKTTIVCPRAVTDMMRDLPLRKIRDLGGKLGAALIALGCETAGDVLKLPLEVVQAAVGDRAEWALALLRGESDEAVIPRELPKSMMAAKSFQITRDMPTMEKWFRILGDELAVRVMQDTIAHKRRPRNLTLHYRGYHAGGPHSKCCPMPRSNISPHPSGPAITAAGLALFNSCSDSMPCVRIALVATDFTAAAPEDARSIKRFFAAPAPAAAPKDGPVPTEAVTPNIVKGGLMNGPTPVGSAAPSNPMGGFEESGLEDEGFLEELDREEEDGELAEAATATATARGAFEELPEVSQHRSVLAAAAQVLRAQDVGDKAAWGAGRAQQPPPSTSADGGEQLRPPPSDRTAGAGPPGTMGDQVIARTCGVSVQQQKRILSDIKIQAHRKQRRKSGQRSISELFKRP